MPDPVRSIELHPAFVWTCEDCGRENFTRVVRLEPELVPDLIPEDRRAEVEGREGDWCLAPDRVTCAYCGAEYETEEA